MDLGNGSQDGEFAVNQPEFIRVWVSKANIRLQVAAGMDFIFSASYFWKVRQQCVSMDAIGLLQLG